MNLVNCNRTISGKVSIDITIGTLGPQPFTQPNDDLWLLGSPLMTHWLVKNTRDFLKFSTGAKAVWT